MDRLKEAIEHCYEVARDQCGNRCANEHIQLAKWLEDLKDFYDMEEQGKLLILPCKPGDTVWDNDFGTPTPYKITGFSFGDLNDDYLEDEEMALDQTIFYYSNSSGSITGIFAESEIGKTVFLTEQEAKETLEGMKK